MRIENVYPRVRSPTRWSAGHTEHTMTHTEEMDLAADPTFVEWCDEHAEASRGAQMAAETTEA